jgi:hypothetical protein
VIVSLIGGVRRAILSRLGRRHRGGVDAAHTISSVLDDFNADGVAQVTTLAAHGLADGATVVISGCSNSAYNGTFHAGVSTADDPTTQFWLLDAGTDSSIALAGSGVGGNWA